jgi:hypothetical protein
MPAAGARAQAADMSRFQFYRTFKLWLGLADGLRSASPRRARALRAVRGRKVTDAIYDAGFNSSGRFYSGLASTSISAIPCPTSSPSCIQLCTRILRRRRIAGMRPSLMCVSGSTCRLHRALPCCGAAQVHSRVPGADCGCGSETARDFTGGEFVLAENSTGLRPSGVI